MKMSYWVEVIVTKLLRWVVITIWLTVTKYPYLKWICSFLPIFFFFLLSPTKLVSDLTIYVSNSMVSIKKQELLTFPEHMGSPPVFGRVCVVHLFFSVFYFVIFVLFVFFLCIVCPMLSVSLDCPFLIALSICYVLFVGFVVFVLCIVYPMLSVSLDCPFVIAISIFSNVYYFY